MIKIICDSISDLPIEIIEKYNIDIVPLTVIFDNKEYLAGETLTTKEFYKILRDTDIMPKTSQATYVQFKSAFEKYDENTEIIYIAGSSTASGTYQSSMLAKNDGHDNVSIFDTQNLSIGSALFVIKACEMVENGCSIEEIILSLEKLKNDVEVVFSVDTLEYLKMGGRISSTKAALGNLLSIKPILEVKDGLVVQKSQVRGKKQIYSTLAKTIVEKFGKDLKSRTIIIGCGDNIEDLEIMKESLEKEAEISNVYFVNIGCVVCSHSGPGVMGISCI
ncbi:MAG: DegV family protein [Clostridiales bacterium]|uniref:DegV family protein n=1 Tax=Terrisporobacter sp. TaxID=1965305 RepID=UPI002A443B52|nr:DegV family protein [Terrisporobacter sp.]MCI5629064.1 DegV family protein [Clostridium sp.]MDD5879491.1 DegV family protein [Clostridiales bacterium]MCI6458424.1 DegV family protein [Clostridium sp.]MCI7207121.1 DegV family protein [Clostridium sp.]MDD7755953.1 DegV family protein [Clostridiales bacterium]